ncbi:hypothetical protein ACOMHN_011789 [Nucella lapillus]
MCFSSKSLNSLNGLMMSSLQPDCKQNFFSFSTQSNAEFVEILSSPFPQLSSSSDASSSTVSVEVDGAEAQVAGSSVATSSSTLTYSDGSMFHSANNRARRGSCSS